MQFPNLSIQSLPTMAQIRPFFSDFGSRISALKTSLFQNPAQTFASLDKRTIAAFSVGTCLAGVALYVLFSKAPAAAPGDGDLVPGSDPVPTGEPVPVRNPTGTEGEPTNEPRTGEGDPTDEPRTGEGDPTDEPHTEGDLAGGDTTRVDGGRIVTYSTVTITPLITSVHNKIEPIANKIIETSKIAIENVERDAFKASVLKGGTPTALAAFAYSVASGESVLVGLALTIAFLVVGTVMHYAYKNSAAIVPAVPF